MRKIINIIVAIGLLVISTGLISSAFVSNIENKTQISTEMWIKDGEPSSDGMACEMNVAKDGNYIFDIIWRSRNEDTPQFLTGIIIKDANGTEVLSCTGNEMDMESTPIALNKGVYYVNFYTLTSEEDANDFRANHNTGLTLSDEFKGYADNTKCQMEYIINMVPETDITGFIRIITGAIIAIVDGFFITKKLLTINGQKRQYDERQTLNRGIALKYSFFTLLGYNALVCLLAFFDVRFPVSIGILLFFGILLGLGIFTTIAIWKDCYFALNEKKRSLFLLFTSVILINLCAAIMNFNYANNEMALMSTSIVILFVFLLAVAIVKTAIDKKEADEE